MFVSILLVRENLSNLDLLDKRGGEKNKRIKIKEYIGGSLRIARNGEGERSRPNEITRGHKSRDIMRRNNNDNGNFRQ